jgi:uncharacterized cysteine cluster protein YcgN (CxxCxxCC family)
MNESESKCLRCGRCCYKKVTYAGKAFFTNIPCRHLNVATRTCTKYAKRYSLPDGCIPFDQAVETRAFPSDCPYVRDIPGYEGPKPYVELANVISILFQSAPSRKGE